MTSDFKQEEYDQRLAEFSDAIARGEQPDSQGIDPVDAALVRDLHALRFERAPDSRLRARLDRELATSPPFGQAQATEPSSTSKPRPLPPFRPVSELDSQGQPVEGMPFSSSPGTSSAGAGARRTSDVRRRKLVWMPAPIATIAATLVLFVLGLGGLLYLATNRGDDSETPNNVAGPSSETVAAMTATAENVVPGMTASPQVHQTEGFLIYSPFEEASSVGEETPISEAYRSTTVVVPWDGAGMVILSGCPNQACDVRIDDQLHLQVTNSAGTSDIILVRSNGNRGGTAHTLPIILTEYFRNGDNSVHAVLWDKEGNRRGMGTPVYVVILR